MKPRLAFEWAALAAATTLQAPVVVGAPAAVTQQHVLQLGEETEPTRAATSRKLHGKFLHITDLHPDQHYKVHSSTDQDHACHRGHGPAGTYGAETSDCDSPLRLVNATLEWVRANLRDEIDFVVWTGDSARHDGDDDKPRRNKEILDMNRRISDAFLDTFSDDKGLVVPVVPTFGNNDIYPHNILLPGPNDVLKQYSDIWKSFIPSAQRHTFEFGGWFFVEVIPDKLAVFSLNTMYFFDRNAGVDDCAQPSEPGYKHFEWLRIQLDFLRQRGMKAILMGHVPPARTSGKQLWDETCWQKYTLWLQQYRDIVVGALYGHMNIDHFLLQDTKDIDLRLVTSANKSKRVGNSTEDAFSIESSTDYLLELRDDWARLPNPVVLEQDVDDLAKKKKKDKKKLGGPWAERYQLSLISPSIVPNYFPSLRVIEYNITDLEDSTTWVDSTSALAATASVEDIRIDHLADEHSLELRQELDFDAEKKKKKHKGRKGRKGKKPKDPNLRVPEPPSEGTGPGPAYAPQPLTLTGFTQYYANLTYLNNDSLGDEESSAGRWDPGKHEGEVPKHKPRPREFTFEVEYSTFDDKTYKLKDLTVKSLLNLAHRIGKASAKSHSLLEEDYEQEEPIPAEMKELLEAEVPDEIEDLDDDDDEEEEEDEDEDSLNGELETEGKHKDKKKKKKGDKHKKKKKKHHKGRKVWLHFLKHAFVSTKSKKALKKMS
ncbi:Metallo-dependent phosphatase-like protein [Xylariaceae sp. FL0804]|nr:Metallo-dependent phosphatase-like protein [Xylariaceae sp. FL0804]